MENFEKLWSHPRKGCAVIIMCSVLIKGSAKQLSFRTTQLHSVQR